MLELDSGGTAANADFDRWQDIARLTCRILLMRGSRSNLVSDASVSSMREANPDLECVDIADAGHHVHVDNAPAFKRELLAFLSRPSS
jgi:esterase